MSVTSSSRPICAAALPCAASAAPRSASPAGVCGSSASTSAPALAADLDDEVVPAVLHHLGQRQVEPRVRGRAGAHRDAEARSARLPALHRDDEHVRPPRLVGRIRMRAAEQHPVEDPHRVQLARARAEERVARRLGRRLDELGQARRPRRDAPATGAPRAAAGSASTSAGRRRSRTAPRRRAGAAGSGRRPARRSSRPGGRRSRRSRRRRSRGRGRSGPTTV